ncbi:hypothetical protein SeLEV6574_g04166 [Synchytrium endobioticum]|nr:hypothetical protein SeLEV6574_g04166 [Synchytrium endobioticum]
MEEVNEGGSDRSGAWAPARVDAVADDESRDSDESSACAPSLVDEVGGDVGTPPLFDVDEEVDGEEADQGDVEFVDISIDEYLTSDKPPPSPLKIIQDSDDDDEFDVLSMPSVETLTLVDMIEQFENMAMNPPSTCNNVEELVETLAFLHIM